MKRSMSVSGKCHVLWTNQTPPTGLQSSIIDLERSAFLEAFLLAGSPREISI